MKNNRKTALFHVIDLQFKTLADYSTPQLKSLQKLK